MYTADGWAGVTPGCCKYCCCRCCWVLLLLVLLLLHILGARVLVLGTAASTAVSAASLAVLAEQARKPKTIPEFVISVLLLSHRRKTNTCIRAICMTSLCLFKKVTFIYIKCFPLSFPSVVLQRN